MHDNWTDRLFKFDGDYGVVQLDGDGGDRPARTGLYHHVTYLLKKYFAIDYQQLPYKDKRFLDIFISQSSDKNGNLFRCPSNMDIKNVSRDQFVALIAALGSYGNKTQIKKYALQFLKNYSRTPNGDLVGPGLWGHILRNLDYWWLWPLYLITDLENLLGGLTICFIKARTPGKIQQWLGAHVHWIFIAGEKPREDGHINDKYSPDNVGGDINHVTIELTCLDRYPTPVSWLSRNMYSYFRPNGVQYAWNVYFDIKTNANPFNILAAPLIQKFITRSST